jgi:3-deoxy-7-phosphoheptulonate synthase
LGINKKGLAATISTTGNQDCHLILRGGSQTGPNYQANQLQKTVSMLKEKRLLPQVMVDCSHENSERDYAKQAKVVHDLCQQIEVGQQAIKAVMMESHLLPGSQKRMMGRPLVYGQSITDACMGWEETEKLLEKLANTIAKSKPAK